jgi:hypothetical protein
MRNSGADVDGVAETEADHFGNCPVCGAWDNMPDLGQVLAHTHGAEIERLEKVRGAAARRSSPLKTVSVITPLSLLSDRPDDNDNVRGNTKRRRKQRMQWRLPSASTTLCERPDAPCPDGAPDLTAQTLQFWKLGTLCWSRAAGTKVPRASLVC